MKKGLRSLAAIAAALALFCQVLIAAPIAERMALERMHEAASLAPLVTVLCTATGVQLVKNVQNSDQHHGHDPACPFCALAAFSMLAAMLYFALAGLLRPALGTLSEFYRGPIAVRFIRPFGSRGPPLIA